MCAGRHLSEPGENVNIRRHGMEHVGTFSPNSLRVPEQPSISGKGISLPTHGDGTTQGRGPIVDNENDTQYNGSGVATSCKPDKLKYRYAVTQCKLLLSLPRLTLATETRRTLWRCF